MLASMSRYVRFDEFGGPEVLHIVQGEEPQAGPGEVRVRVHTAGLNPVDLKILHGGPACGSSPCTMCSTSGPPNSSKRT